MPVQPRQPGGKGKGKQRLSRSLRRRQTIAKTSVNKPATQPVNSVKPQPTPTAPITKRKADPKRNAAMGKPQGMIPQKEHSANKVAAGMAEPGAKRRCWYFNSSRGCSISGSDCKFEHACSSCGKSNHSMVNCRNMKPEITAELK